MFCSKCGRKLTDQDRFCPGCGYARFLEKPDPTNYGHTTVGCGTNPPKTAKRKKPLMLVMLIFLLAAVISIPVILLAGRSNTVTLYVLTEKIEYFQSTPHKRIVNTYDSSARLLTTETDYGDEAIWMENLKTYQYEIHPYNGTVESRSVFEYDEAGNTILQLIDWGKQARYAYEYDSEGRILKYIQYRPDSTKEDGIVFTISYDDAGNLESATGTSNDQVVFFQKYVYDDRGRLVQEIFCDKDSALRIDYVYADNLLIRQDHYKGRVERGQPDSHIDFQISSFTDYAYDRKGRLIKETQKYADGDVFLERIYEYDKRGNLKQVSGKNIIREEYTYDSQGNIVRIQIADDYWMEYKYVAMEVSPQQAEAYRNRTRLQEACHTEYGDAVYYYMIPNPCWELPYYYEP